MYNLIPGYSEGANLTIMNAFYRRPTKDPATGKWEPDYIVIVYKDNDTGKKDMVRIPKPSYTYYILKSDVPTPDHNCHFAPIEDVDPITVPYRDVLRSIAENTGNLDLFETNRRNNDYRANQLFMLHPRVFGADMPILAFYRTMFNKLYANPVTPITIAYFDIEADVLETENENIVYGRDVINMISMYFNGNKTMYNFILRNPKNPQIEEMEKDMEKDFDKYKQEFIDLIKVKLNSQEKIVKYGLDNIKLSVGFFDSEIDMIATFFACVNELQPDIAVAYNMAYDMQQLIARIQYHGLDPIDIICNTKYMDKKFCFCEYYSDADKEPKFEERCDRADICSLTTYLDQLIIYASRRKGQSAIASFELNYVGGYECGVTKLDYHDISPSIGKFPYINFKMFWLYNLTDVIVQVCLEEQTSDIKYVFNNVIEMNTPYQKIFRQTVYLADKATEYYREAEGVVIGNNANKFGSPPDKKFPGAFVAPPNLLTNRNKLRTLSGFIIDKFNNGNDFDYKRLYPSLLQYFNMAPNTQVGMIDIANPPFRDDDSLMLEPGGTFVENLASYNYIEFCHRWLNMGRVEDCYSDIKEYFTKYKTPRSEGPGNKLYDDRTQVVKFYRNDKPVYLEPKISPALWNEIRKIQYEIKSYIES